MGTGGVVGKPQRRPRRFLAGLAAAKLAAGVPPLTVRSRIIQRQTMPKRDKMEVEFAFLVLAVFAAFMAARSLTAYFKKK